MSEAAIVLVARFLKSRGYSETLDTLRQEANIKLDDRTIDNGSLTIEKVLEEKRVFDVSLKFEKLGVEEGKRWNSTAPAVATPVKGPTSSNVLHLSFARIKETSSSDQNTLSLLATTADRRLNLIDVPNCNVRNSLVDLQDSPILSCVILRGGYLLTGSMSGKTMISDIKGNVLDQRRDHNKYVVQVAMHEKLGTTWIATAGWDGKIHVYELGGDDTKPSFDAPIATIEVPTNPEALLFIEHPDNGQPILIVTRRDSTYLFYYSLESSGSLLGRQNIAPHANSWASFSPSSIALCPTDNTLIAIATSAMPHMRLLVVRLMIPPIAQGESATDAAQAVPAPILGEPQAIEGLPASAARAALALQEREAAAILIHSNTMAPQTAYSTPALAWRPDGSGLWVNADDGVLRGIEASTGKIVATLKGHDLGSKIRCLCTGLIEGKDGVEEWLVSGGFDQKLIVWTKQASAA